MNSTSIETTDNALKELLQFKDSNCPSNEMKKPGDLLIAFQKEKKEKMQESSVVFTLKQDLYWLHDWFPHISGKSVVAIF